MSPLNFENGHNSNIFGTNIISSRDLLMMALVRFYKQNNNSHIARIIPIIEGKNKISLRLIDWFVTNYSKKYNVIIPKKKKQYDAYDTEYLNVYISYRQQLKAFSKQQFDPFRRRDRIKFFYNKENDWIETTIGQLNFFKWVIQNNILEYITQNIRFIEADMITSQKKSQKDCPKDKHKKHTLDTKNNETIASSPSQNNPQTIIKKGRGRNKKNLNTFFNYNENDKNDKNTQNTNNRKTPISNDNENNIISPNKKIKNNSLKNFNISDLINKSNMIVGPKIIKFD